MGGQRVIISGAEVRDIAVAVSSNASGDSGLHTIQTEVNPLDTACLNPSYSFTRDANGYLTKLELIVAGTTYTKDFARDADDYVSSITGWY